MNAPVACTVSRPLTKEDLLRHKASTLGAQTPPLARIRQVHHRLAQLMAQGLKDVEIAAITNYSQSRLSILKNDPAFQELMQHYAQTQQAAFVDTLDILAGLAADTLSELRTRLEEQPETLSNKDLLQLSQLTLDRSGNGPVSTQRNENFNISAKELDELRRSTIARQQGAVVIRQAAPAGRGADKRLIIEGQSVGETSASEGSESGWASLREENIAPLEKSLFGDS